MRRRRPIVCLAAATLALLAAATGQAAPPQDSRTNPNAGAISPQAARESRLPFSGLDLALLTAGGAPLLLIGASLRRRQPKPAMQPASEETLTLA